MPLFSKEGQSRLVDKIITNKGQFYASGQMFLTFRSSSSQEVAGRRNMILLPDWSETKFRGTKKQIAPFVGFFQDYFNLSS
jgi:hypothetical protein